MMRGSDFLPRVGFSLLASLLLHAFILFGIGFKLPDAMKLKNSTPPLEIVLVNAKSRAAPDKPDVLAQANLEGGGDTEINRRAKSPLPSQQTESRPQDVESAARKVAQLEQEAQRLLTQIKAGQQVPSRERREQNLAAAQSEELAQKSLDIARLEAQIDKDTEAYQKKPRLSFVGARAREYRFARYVEDWRIKVERIGNLNYPEAARKEQIYGNLQLSVYINSDGSLDKVVIDRSSGQKVLDDSAIRIVKLAAPYSPLPPDIRKDTDILCITRTWMFTRADELISK